MKQATKAILVQIIPIISALLFIAGCVLPGRASPLREFLMYIPTLCTLGAAVFGILGRDMAKNESQTTKTVSTILMVIDILITVSVFVGAIVLIGLIGTAKNHY